jgi:hypothetical protein
LSKIDFSLNSTQRTQALGDLLVRRKERSKPLIFHAGKAFSRRFGLTKARLLASPAFGQHFEGKGNLKSQLKI